MTTDKARDCATYATILKMDGDPEGPAEHDTRRRNPCWDCGTMKLDYHEPSCSIHRSVR